MEDSALRGRAWLWADPKAGLSFMWKRAGEMKPSDSRFQNVDFRFKGSELCGKKCI